MGKIKLILVWALIRLIQAYRVLISPLLGQRCRFTPSCSQYMCDAMLARGPVFGSLLGLRRLCRCHPFCPGGYDPVISESKKEG